MCRTRNGPNLIYIPSFLFLSVLLELPASSKQKKKSEQANLQDRRHVFLVCSFLPLWQCWVACSTKAAGCFHIRSGSLLSCCVVVVWLPLPCACYACACGCCVVAIAMRVLSLLHIRIIYSLAIHRVAVLCIKKLDRDHTRVIYILDIRNICHSFL